MSCVTGGVGFCRPLNTVARCSTSSALEFKLQRPPGLAQGQNVRPSQALPKRADDHGGARRRLGLYDTDEEPTFGQSRNRHSARRHSRDAVRSRPNGLTLEERGSTGWST